MKYEQLDKNLFIENRKLFSEKLNKNTLAIFNSNDIMPTNADGYMPFRQNNDLFWLSGIDQEESVLVVFPNHSDENMREILKSTKGLGTPATRADIIEKLINYGTSLTLSPE